MKKTKETKREKLLETKERGSESETRLRKVLHGKNRNVVVGLVKQSGGLVSVFKSDKLDEILLGEKQIPGFLEGAWYLEGKNVKANLRGSKGVYNVLYREMAQGRSYEKLVKKLEEQGGQFTENQLTYYTKSIGTYVAKEGLKGKPEGTLKGVVDFRGVSEKLLEDVVREYAKAKGEEVEGYEGSVKTEQNVQIEASTHNSYIELALTVREGSLKIMDYIGRDLVEQLPQKERMWLEKKKKTWEKRIMEEQNEYLDGRSVAKGTYTGVVEKYMGLMLPGGVEIKNIKVGEKGAEITLQSQNDPKYTYNFFVKPRKGSAMVMIDDVDAVEGKEYLAIHGEYVVNTFKREVRRLLG